MLYTFLALLFESLNFIFSFSGFKTYINQTPHHFQTPATPLFIASSLTSTLTSPKPRPPTLQLTQVFPFPPILQHLPQPFNPPLPLPDRKQEIRLPRPLSNHIPLLPAFLNRLKTSSNLPLYKYRRVRTATSGSQVLNCDSSILTRHTNNSRKQPPVSQAERLLSTSSHDRTSLSRVSPRMP